MLMFMRSLNGLEKSTMLRGVDFSPECGPWWGFLDKRAHTLWVGLQRCIGLFSYASGVWAIVING
jgi:hypothetical protein